jgi:hypothetical protein
MLEGVIRNPLSILLRVFECIVSHFRPIHHHYPSDPPWKPL